MFQAPLHVHLTGLISDKDNNVRRGATWSKSLRASGRRQSRVHAVETGSQAFMCHGLIDGTPERSCASRYHARSMQGGTHPRIDPIQSIYLSNRMKRVCPIWCQSGTRACSPPRSHSCVVPQQSWLVTFQVHPKLAFVCRLAAIAI